MRVLALVTDAFGGRGGIAKFNRDMLSAVCAHRACREIVVLPRLITETPGEVPARISVRAESARGKAAYIAQLGRAVLDGEFDGVICGHLNLLPAAAAAASITRAPLILVVHGVEAWSASRRALTRRALRRVDALVSVSDFTRRRFLAWSGIALERSRVIPNCIERRRFGPGPRRPDLVARYGLGGRAVIMTLGRLSSAERYKGIDEVLELLPVLAEEIPTVTYLVAGDGDDRPRLQRKAEQLGVRERVVFTGYVSDDEKADHYRLADAYVMPGRGEGFGIVYLEALACGLPVIASSADASREAVRDGLLGYVVAPDRPEDIRAAIRAAIATEHRRVPDGLSYFSVERFTERWHAVADAVIDTVPRIAEGAGADTAFRSTQRV